jgi:hypothetical protein
MSTKNLLPLSVSPSTVSGLDKVIETIRLRLDYVSWLRPYNYGRAYTDITAAGNRTPIVYAGNGEYVSAMPNDDLRAMSFFTPVSAEKTDYSQGRQYLKSERDVALIVWVNLKELNHSEAGESYIYTESLKEQLYTILQNSPEVTAIKSFKDNDVSQVYEGFDFESLILEYATENTNNLGNSRTLLKKTPIQGKYVKHPYAAFRIEFSVKYYMSC